MSVRALPSGALSRRGGAVSSRAMPGVRLRRLLLLGVLLAACQSRGLADVRRATTPAEERAAFAALAREGVSFAAFDADGEQLDLGGEKWWEKARSLRLGAGGESIEHGLIDPHNVLELMRE